MRHLYDHYIHRVVCIDTLFFATNNLAEYAPLNGDTLVAFCSTSRYCERVFVKAEAD